MKSPGPCDREFRSNVEARPARSNSRKALPAVLCVGRTLWCDAFHLGFGVYQAAPRYGKSQVSNQGQNLKASDRSVRPTRRSAITSVTCPKVTNFLTSQHRVSISAAGLNARGPIKDIMVDARRSASVRCAWTGPAGVTFACFHPGPKPARRAKSGLQGGSQVSP